VAADPAAMKGKKRLRALFFLVTIVVASGYALRAAR